MRVLYATGSPASYMAPPRLSDQQINCGPDWPDQRAHDGRILSLKTPVGDYDLATILAKLPADQKPDAVVCLVDASWRNTPRNLGCFGGPKALLVADTHHLKSPLVGMVRYAASEVFDRIVFLYDRHHLDFFRSAGLKNLFWFPGLTFPHRDSAVQAARRAKRDPKIAFVGQAGKFHPRRARMLDALRNRRLPVEQKSMPQRAALDFYGASLLGFNASLNGDFNLRVFEILASGAALLTDHLAPSSGLEQLFKAHRDILVYRSAEELAEVTAHAIANPKDTAAIGSAGASWFDTHFNEARRRESFQDLLLNGVEAPGFECPAASTTSVLFGGNTEQVLQAMIVYEGVQELHRSQETVRVAVDSSVAADVDTMMKTLPRVEVIRGDVQVDADLAIVSRSEVGGLDPVAASRLWCWDARPVDFGSIAETLAAANFKLVSNDVAVLCRVEPTVETKSSDGRSHVLLYTDDPDSGGVAQYNHSLMVGLVEAGYRVSCAQTRSENPLVKKQRELGIAHHWIPYDTKSDFARTFRDGAGARQILGAVQPDLVIFSDCCPVSNMAAREVARIGRVPYIAVVGFVGAYLADRFAPVLGALRAQYAQARAVVAVSQENLNLLRTRFELAATAGQVVHYGRPEKFFAPRDSAVRAGLRREIGVPDDAVMCFTAARLAAVKGYAYQIEAAKLLAKMPGGDRVHFVWAGEGEQRSELERAIVAAGLKQRIHLLGHRWDVADWYDAADIFTLPSDLEGMPLAIMEAMAKGLPVIATAVSGIPEELGDTGQLLPSAAVDRKVLISLLAQTVHTWAQQPDIRRAIGDAGRRRAQTMFREALMIERTVELVRQQLPVGSLAQEETLAATT